MQELLRLIEKARRNDSGFTLVELLIVVAIIGVLVAIIVPVMGGQIEAAERRACHANQRTIESAAAAYKASEGEWPSNGNNDEIDDLEAEGFLDEIPDCPADDGEGYELTASDEEIKATCTNDDHAHYTEDNED